MINASVKRERTSKKGAPTSTKVSVCNTGFSSPDVESWRALVETGFRMSHECIWVHVPSILSSAHVSDDDPNCRKLNLQKLVELFAKQVLNELSYISKTYWVNGAETTFFQRVTTPRVRIYIYIYINK